MHALSFSSRQFEYSGDMPDGYIIPDDTLSANRPPRSEQYNRVVATVGNIISGMLENENRSILVGVNGVDTSGKTEFSIALGDRLNEQETPQVIVHLDDFMNPKDERHKGDDAATNYYDNALDFNTLRNGLLVPVQNGQNVDVTFDHPHPANDRWRLHHRYVVQAPSVVLTEGVFLFRPEMRDLFDLRIFLDLPLDKVLERARHRDFEWGGEAVMRKYVDKYIPAQKRYLTIAQPALSANVVLDMSRVEEPKILKSSN